jgi:hypothetical protein
MKIILKCASHECSPDDIEWALVTLDAPLLERALARRQCFDDRLIRALLLQRGDAVLPKPTPELVLSRSG